MIYENYHKEYTDKEIETLKSIVDMYGYCEEAFVIASEELSRPKDLLKVAYRRRYIGRKLRRGERLTSSGQVKPPKVDLDKAVDLLFNAMKEGKISMKEYTKACEGIEIIKKVI